MCPESLLEKLRALPKLAEMASWAPRTVRHAPVRKWWRTHRSLDALPILKCWPQDGGRFITLPLVITQHPETGLRNVGMYRMQVYDGQTTGMHWHPHKVGAEHYRAYEAAGKRMPVAVALGCDPATIYAATAPLPAEFDEFLFAGFLRRRAVDLVPAKTVDLLVPAEAEFVLEGYVDPGERRLEGPFGDHTGYYSLADEFPVFHLTALDAAQAPALSRYHRGPARRRRTSISPRPPSASSCRCCRPSCRKSSTSTSSWRASSTISPWCAFASPTPATPSKSCTPCGGLGR